MKYVVRAQITISVSTEVEAKTAKEARKLAAEKPLIGLCHQCASGDPEAEWVTSGELDAQPVNLKVGKVG